MGLRTLAAQFAAEAARAGWQILASQDGDGTVIAAGR